MASWVAVIAEFTGKLEDRWTREGVAVPAFFKDWTHAIRQAVRQAPTVSARGPAIERGSLAESAGIGQARLSFTLPANGNTVKSKQRIMGDKAVITQLFPFINDAKFDPTTVTR
jgi:hypothetical protein